MVGGAKPRTAHRRARRAAERITAAAARLAHVVDVQAVAGVPGTDGELAVAEPVYLPMANSGRGTYSTPDKLSRYIDPEHDRALGSLEGANAAHQQRRKDDTNAEQYTLIPARDCACVYCAPPRHLDALTVDAAPTRGLLSTATPPGQSRCSDHGDIELVILDGDDKMLLLLADQVAR